MPGLLDSHIHLAGFHSRTTTPTGAAEEIAQDTLDVVAGLSALARSGIAAVRDAGYPHHGIFAVRQAAAGGLFPSPRLLLSGRALCASGGHAESLSVRVDGVDEVRRATRLECKAGADWIKLMVTGGTATPGELVTDVQLTFDEIRAAVEEAHARGRKVCAHLSNLPGTVLALRAGVDSVEHGIELDDEAIHLMLERNVWLSAGLKCTEVEGVNRPEDRVPEFIARKGGAIYQTQGESFRKAVKAGVRISAATDGYTDYFPPSGRTLARELAYMCNLGLTSSQVIDVATRETAELLKQPDLGTLAPGKRADILVVDGDPLSDIMRLAEPWLVMLGGQIVRKPGEELSYQESVGVSSTWEE
jgi:imidazolonepropionase-like amidohydrolase